MVVSIYKITDCTGLCYVGSTKHNVKKRLSNHCYEKRNGTGYCSSKKLDLDNCDIQVLETCNPEVRYEREQHYINTIDCVNEFKLNFNRKEYHKEYREKHKDKTAQHEKKRREYSYSWGGDRRFWNNNLLMIDVNLFQ